MGCTMFSDFIDEKGVRPLSLVFGVSIFTIYSWRRRNNIPRDRWDTILSNYPRMTWRRLVDMEVSSRASQAA